MFWIISNTNYDKLCNIEGCENYTGLEFAEEDINQMKHLAKCYGVDLDNLHIDLNADKKQLGKTQVKILKRCDILEKEGVEYVVMVYCRGFGCTKDEKQILLLNSDKPG